MVVASSNKCKGIVAAIPRRGGGGTQGAVSVEVCRQSRQNLALFKTKIADFATLFKTRELTESGNFFKVI